jgi:hypothetical protein
MIYDRLIGNLKVEAIKLRCSTGTASSPCELAQASVEWIVPDRVLGHAYGHAWHGRSEEQCERYEQEVCVAPRGSLQ